MGICILAGIACNSICSDAKYSDIILSKQASTNSLWFGRDVFGRRSLLWHLPVHGENCFGLSSLGQYDDVSQPQVRPLITILNTLFKWPVLQGFWLEVPALGIYQLRFTGTAFEAGIDILAGSYFKL